MDVWGWKLISMPDTEAGQSHQGSGDSSFRPNSGWGVDPSLDRNVQLDFHANHFSADSVRTTDVSDPSVGYRAQHTPLGDLNNGLNNSTESLPDWDRISDYDVRDEEQCLSLPSMDMICNDMETSESRNKRRDSIKRKEKDKTLKNRVITAWTNVTNGWAVLKTSTSFKNDSVIWLLGRRYGYACYNHKTSGEDLLDHPHGDKSSFNQFKLDFSSLIWLTYRIDFEKLAGSQLTNDVGWGCMLRSGQMMLARAFVVHFLGRNWLWHFNNSSEEESVHRRIIRYFGDFDEHPFSIQRLVKISEKLGRHPGDWFGPASICVVLRDALEEAKLNGNYPELSSLNIYLTMDGTVFKQDVIDLWTRNTGSSPLSNGGSEPVQSLVIVMAIRLGSETVNEVYLPCLRNLLENKFCIGIIGGKPKRSLYFVGWQDDELIHLDPHCCQETIQVSDDDFPLESFHCGFPRKLAFNKMDPTCTIGFYCKNRQEFDELVEVAPKLVARRELASTPLLSFEAGRRAEFLSGCRRSEDSCTKTRPVLLQSVAPSGRVKISEFTLL